MFIDLPGDIPGLRAQASNADKPWYSIKNADSDEAELLLYDEIGGWFGILAEDFIADLKAITAPKLKVRVNSPGGSVFQGIALANALRSHPAEVTVQVDGIAASIASVIAMAGDRVVVQPQSMIMIHDASGGCLGNAADMQAMADLLDKISGNIAGAYSAKAGGTRDEWRQAMKAESWYTAEEAVAAGLADELGVGEGQVPEPGPDDPDMHRSFDLTAYGYVGPKRKVPKPAPPAPAPAAEPAAETALTESIADALGAKLVEQLRAALAAAPAEPEPEPADTAVPTHHTDTVDSTWDGGAAEKRLPSPVPVATVKKAYAWYDGDAVEDGAVPKGSCKLPHHEVSADGTPGAANLAGVRNALSRLPQTKGIPDSEKAAVEAHLRAHLKDGGAEDWADPALTATAPPEDDPAPAEPADDWAAAVAHLTKPAADTWAAAVAHLTNPAPAPSSAATEA